ncbi:RHS repeat-associated core domain-containing protein [Bacillus sp. Hm123]|uniref:RHS repeat-associated core domain-containing protein n=1 Tax=Bacillus sp. Hm123 TaxID=3450745 RepID=UPI003F42F18E
MADINPYRYASYRHDNETGLYYLLARYYESKEGFFLTIDPQSGEAKDPISQHPYVYVQNNPVMLDDPDGENPYVAVLVYVGGRWVVKQSLKKSLKNTAKKYKGKIKVKHTVKKKSPKAVARKVTGYTKHGINQAIGRDGGRGVSSKAILNAIRNPKKIQKQSGGRTKYVGKYAVVVLNAKGKVITTYAKSSKGFRKK